VTEPPFSVFCVPFAGAGAGIFRKWQGFRPERLRFVPVQFPGREERFGEEPCKTMLQLVDECVQQIRSTAAGGRFAVFGHSFGALVAYETARYLVEREVIRPTCLIVSGAAAPSVRRLKLGLSELPDDELVGRLAEQVGYDHRALHHPELRELLLPALRSDLAIADGYEPQAAYPLPVPISAVRGTRDQMVSSEDAALWKSATSSDFRLVEIPGDHMYFADDWTSLAAHISQLADAVVPA